MIDIQIKNDNLETGKCNGKNQKTYFDLTIKNEKNKEIGDKSR